MTLRTTVHLYNYNLDDKEDKKEYDKLFAKLNRSRVLMFKASGDYYRNYLELDGQIVELDLEKIWDNQWNAKFGRRTLRLFDWAENIYTNKKIKRGHWLEQTKDMKELRCNTNTCGYCGHQEAAARGKVFCDQCRGNEFLKEADLHLTRMVSVDWGRNRARAELTQTEQDLLIPAYHDAQEQRRRERRPMQKKGLARLRDQAIEKANIQYHGRVWLLDHDLDIDNVIYYDTSKKWRFGWSRPVDAAMRDKLLDALTEFPYDYEIVCDDGKTLG